MRRVETTRVYVSSLGCKLNQSEMDSLAARMAQEGFLIVASPDEADLCVLNTCAVTHVAAQKSRQALRRLHRQNPSAELVVTGCYAELSPEDLRDLPGVEKVVGNQDKERLWELLRAPGQDRGASELPQAVKETPTRIGSRTRATVKIQDGCDNACTYCIIHVARGSQISRPSEQVLAEIQAQLRAGYQEIVLTGVHIGAYGRDRAGEDRFDNLWSLVAQILTELDVPRLRLSSIEPWDLSAQAFQLWEDRRLCRHLHLPLQSGSDRVLRRMGRQYTTDEFEALVQSARAQIPDLAVTTDVIVGFPGESEQEFAENLAFVRSMVFAGTHVFPYSVRPGTPAAEMPNQVSPPVKATRAKAMRGVALEGSREYRGRFVGRTMDVLWESRSDLSGTLVWQGLTDNYLRVQAKSTSDLRNTFTPTRLTRLSGNGLHGEIETENRG